MYICHKNFAVGVYILRAGHPAKAMIIVLIVSMIMSLWLGEQAGTLPHEALTEIRAVIEQVNATTVEFLEEYI